MMKSPVILQVGRQDAMHVISLRKHPSALTSPHHEQLVAANRKTIEQQQDSTLHCMVRHDSGIVQDSGTCGCSGVLRAASG